MNTLVFRAAVDRDATRPATRRTVGPWFLRGLSIAVCAASITIAWHAGDPTAAVLADPELAGLLRGMAALKGLMVVAAIAILLWRFGHPIAPRVAAAYLASTGLMAASAMMIWQLTALLPAAVAFHVGLFVSLIVAWRADGDLSIRSTLFG